MELIGLILQIILLGLFLIWEGYNKKKGENLAMKEDSREINYEVEKGRDLATKEDIGDITDIIKSVESKFTNQTEELKSKLSLLSNVKSEIYSTERNAIIDVNEKLYMWLSHLKQNPSFDNNDEIEKYLKEMDSHYDKEQASGAMLELFIDDDSIIKIFKKISEHILVTHIKKKSVLYQIMKNKTEELSQEQKNQLNDIADRIVVIHPIIQEFRRNCKKYIYSKSLAKPEA